jgi:hypothetical protein
MGSGDWYRVPIKNFRLFSSLEYYIYLLSEFLLNSSFHKTMIFYPFLDLYRIVCSFKLSQSSEMHVLYGEQMAF